MLVDQFDCPLIWMSSSYIYIVEIHQLVLFNVAAKLTPWPCFRIHSQSSLQRHMSLCIFVQNHPWWFLLGRIDSGFGDLPDLSTATMQVCQVHFGRFPVWIFLFPFEISSRATEFIRSLSRLAVIMEGTNAEVKGIRSGPGLFPS